MTPNAVTFSRFFFGILMIFSSYFENTFLFVLFYALSIVSDVLDGFLARKSKKTSEYGKKLDIIADTFIVVCIGLSLFFLGKIKYIEIFVVIIFYYLLIQAISLLFKGKFIFQRSYAANLAAIAFPFLVFSMLFYEVVFLAYAYAVLMIYSLTEKLFLSFGIKKNILFYFVLLALIALIILIPKNINDKKEVCFGSKCIDVDIMDTNEERALGLMYRANLNQDEGMLFIFEQPGNYQFYMKNMLIPIDMIFVDENMRIVKIYQNVQPCIIDHCELYFAESPVKYVVEVNSGFSEKFEIKEESIIKIK